MNETKVRILDAAEKLIAEHGSEVSLRSITSEAGVNLAAVNYHFQTKDALLEAIVARRFDPMNAQRLEMLDELEAEYPAGPLPLERVLEAFLGPVVDLRGNPASHFRQLMGRFFSMPDEFLMRIFSRHMLPVVERFSVAFERSVPGVPEIEVMWRMVFSIGAMVHIMNWTKILPVVTGGRIDTQDTAALKSRMIAFSAAGFRAALAQTQGEHQ